MYIEKPTTIQDTYWTARRVVAKALDKNPDSPLEGMTNALAGMTDALAQLFAVSREGRVLMASVLLTAAHAESFERGLSVVFNMSPEDVLDIADRGLAIAFGLEDDDDSIE